MKMGRNNLVKGILISFICVFFICFLSSLSEAFVDSPSDFYNGGGIPPAHQVEEDDGGSDTVIDNHNIQYNLSGVNNQIPNATHLSSWNLYASETAGDLDDSEQQEIDNIYVDAWRSYDSEGSPYAWSGWVKNPLDLKKSGIFNRFRPFSTSDGSADNLNILFFGGININNEEFQEWQESVYQEVDFSETDKLAFVKDLTNAIYENFEYDSLVAGRIEEAQQEVVEGIKEGKYENRELTDEEVMTMVGGKPGMVVKKQFFQVFRNKFDIGNILLNDKAVCREIAIVENYMLGQNGIYTEILDISPFHTAILAEIDNEYYVVDPTLDKVMLYQEYVDYFKTKPGVANVNRTDGIPDTDFTLDKNQDRPSLYKESTKLAEGD